MLGREVIGKDTKLLLGSVLFLLGNNSYLNRSRFKTSDRV